MKMSESSANTMKMPKVKDPPRAPRALRNTTPTMKFANRSEAARVSRMVYEGGLPVEGARFACDSFVFNLHSGTPALIWGPKGGNAHAPDEYVEVEPFMDLVKMYALTMIEWCGVSR
jgi:acetylornithine deacetylase/succinyl-diaminopimelate desuccinylase-like protein